MSYICSYINGDFANPPFSLYSTTPIVIGKDTPPSLKNSKGTKSTDYTSRCFGDLAQSVEFSFNSNTKTLADEYGDKVASQLLVRFQAFAIAMDAASSFSDFGFLEEIQGDTKDLVPKDASVEDWIMDLENYAQLPFSRTA